MTINEFFAVFKCTQTTSATNGWKRFQARLLPAAT